MNTHFGNFQESQIYRYSINNHPSIQSSLAQIMRNLYYKKGSQYFCGGCNIRYNSLHLLISHLTSNPKCHQQPRLIVYQGSIPEKFDMDPIQLDPSPPEDISMVQNIEHEMENMNSNTWVFGDM